MSDSFQIFYDCTELEFPTAVAVVTGMTGPFLSITCKFMSMFTFPAKGTQ